MGQRINIVELLKNAPKGIELYSPICRTVILQDVDNDSIKVTVKDYPSTVPLEYLFDKYGEVYGQDGECLLFPSKDCRTWKSFKAPWKYKHFEPFQKVLVGANSKWVPDFYGFLDESKEEFCHYIIAHKEYVADKDIIPYEGNEDYLEKIDKK